MQTANQGKATQFNSREKKHSTESQRQKLPFKAQVLFLRIIEAAKKPVGRRLILA